MDVPVVHRSIFPAASSEEGTRDELRALYQQHHAFVRGAVLRLGGPDCDVEDLVHDVFLVALRRHQEFEHRSAWSTWLYGIAVRVVSRARQRARLRQFFHLESRPEPVETRTPHRLFEHREASAALYEILDQLSERKRTVFVLYEIEELSGQEIADIVGCPLRTVWTRLHHARKEFAHEVERRDLIAAEESRGKGRRP